MKYKLVATGLLAVMLAGCSAGNLDVNEKEAKENGGAYKQEVVVDKQKSSENPSDNKISENSPKDEKTSTQTESLKILSTHKMEVESDNFKEDIDFLEEKVHNLGGYVNSNKTTSESSGKRKEFKESEISLKIPKENISSILKEIENRLNVVAETKVAVDVTDDYYDLESTLKSLTDREERLLELYNSSDDINEIMKIDEKLYEVSQEKESISREKMRINDKISFAKIDLIIKEVAKIETSEKENLTSGEKISKAFKSTIKMAFAVLTFLIVWIIKLSPLGLLAAAIIFGYKKIKGKYDERIVESPGNNEDESTEEISAESEEQKQIEENLEEDLIKKISEEEKNAEEK